MKSFLTTAEAARLLRCTPATIREWVASGELRAVRAGKRWLVPQDAVDQFLGLHSAPARPSRQAERDLAELQRRLA